MNRVFVFEYLTAGGPVEGDETALQTLLPQGLRMRDAIVTDLLQAGGWTVTAASCARAPAPPSGARACQARRGESMPEYVARQAAQHDTVWLVAPETAGLLAQLHQAVPAGRWLGCEAAAIALTTGKRATLVQLAAHGLRTPLDFEREATRWVVKPDDGAGAIDSTVHASLAAGRQALRSGMTLEPWVDGEALSLSLRCRAGTAELLSINRQRIHVGTAGRLEYAGVDIDCLPRQGATGDTLAALARQVARAIPGLHGFVGVDLVWHPAQGPVVIEVNPRVTCAYVGLSARLGRNLGAELLADHIRETRHALA